MVKRMLGLSAVALFVLAACGKSSNGAAWGGSPSQAASGAVTVNAVKVAGVGTVLVDSQGLTLYHLQGETTSSVKCTAGCLTTWPPLLDTSGVKPTAGAGVTGTLSTFSLPGGT